MYMSGFKQILMRWDVYVRIKTDTDKDGMYMSGFTMIQLENHCVDTFTNELF